MNKTISLLIRYLKEKHILKKFVSYALESTCSGFMLDLQKIGHVNDDNETFGRYLDRSKISLLNQLDKIYDLLYHEQKLEKEECDDKIFRYAFAWYTSKEGFRF